MRRILLEVIKSNIYYFTLLKKQMKKANIPESKIDELKSKFSWKNHKKIINPRMTTLSLKEFIQEINMIS